MNIHNLASGKGSTAHFSGEIQSDDIILQFLPFFMVLKKNNFFKKDVDISASHFACL